MIQLLWDRGEANGYVYHMVRDPLPEHAGEDGAAARGVRRPPGDATSPRRPRRASSARACARRALDPGRSRDRVPFWGIKRDPALPVEGQRADDLRHRAAAPGRLQRGAACLGTPPAPVTNIPPDIGVDPHGDHRDRAERGARVLGLPQGRRRLRRPLRAGQALLRRGLDGAVRALGAVARRVRRARGRRARRCRRLRPDRPLALPLPWPNDYFREPRPPRADAPSMMPANASGTPIEPADYNWSDGFSPGGAIVTKVPGLDTPAAFAQHRRGADHRRRPLVRPRPADPRDQRPHAAAPADLGRARLERVDAGEHRAADPPGEELARGRALHRRPAQPARRRRRAAPSRAPPSALPRPDPDHSLRLRARADRTWRRSSGRCKRAGVKRRELYLAWDFTVASAHSLSGRLRRIRDDAFRGARRHQPRRPPGEGRAAQVHDRQVTDFGADGARTARRRSAAAWRARSRCPATSTSPAARRARASGSGRTASRVRTPGNINDANFICNIPRSVTSATPGRLSLYGHGLFGSAGEVNSISQPADRQRAQGGAVRERLHRHVRRRRAEHDLDPAGPVAFPSWPTASSRASSTSSSSGAR